VTNRAVIGALSLSRRILQTFGGSVGMLVEKAKGVIIERVHSKTRTRWQASKGR
jgi:hypothetical protein